MSVCVLSVVLTILLSLLSSTTRATNYTNIHWQHHSHIGQGPRQEHSVAAIGNEIYVVGGVAKDDKSDLVTINRVEVYDTVANSWAVAAPLPEPLNHVNIASNQNKLYSLGGLSAGKDWVAVNSSYVYNPINDVWSDLAPLPGGTARGSSAVCVYNNTIYLAGGMTILQPYMGGGQDSLASVLAYDITKDTWSTTLPPLPQPRQHVGGVVINSTFYVIGGRENGIEQYHNTTYALDLDSPETGWIELAPMPTARGSLTCSAVDAYIYCMGGEGNPDSPLRIFNETEVYDIRKDQWTKLMPMALPRHGTASVVVGNSIYVPGGGAATASLPVGIIDSLQIG